MILLQVREVHIFKHRLYISVLEQARVLILGRYVLLGVIITIYKHCHAWVILWDAAEKDHFFGPWTLYLSFGTCHEVNIMQLCSFSIHKQNM